MATTIYLCPLSSIPSNIILRDPTSGCPGVLPPFTGPYRNLTVSGVDEDIAFLAPGSPLPSISAFDPSFIDPHDDTRRLTIIGAEED